MSFVKKYANAIEYLLESGDIFIRYRTLTELCGMQCQEDLQKKIIHSERAQKILQCLREHKEYHGATLYSVENSLNILIDMGFRYDHGFTEFDQILDSLYDELRKQSTDPDHVLRFLFCHLVTIPFLARAGMCNSFITDFIQERIELIYDFVIQDNYDIYDDVSKYKNIPKSFRSRSIISPQLYENGHFQFPLIYDLYGFSGLMTFLPENMLGKVNRIISYILDNRFQAIEDGYGILHSNKGYHAMGWDPKPPTLTDNGYSNSILLRAELFGSFEAGRHSVWFNEMTALLEKYTDEYHLYHFPKYFLTEKDSCWILGNHMSLGENRRRKNALTLESTFHALKIMRLLDLN